MEAKPTVEHSIHPPSDESARPNFRTLSEVFKESAHLLAESAIGLQRLSETRQLTPRECLVLRTVAQARTSASRDLMAHRETAPARANEIWVQFGQLFQLKTDLRTRLEHAEDVATALNMVQDIDDRLEAALSHLADSYMPPLESCEKTADVIQQLKRTTSGISNSASDI